MSETHHFELQSQLNDQVEGDGNVTLSTGKIDYGVPSQFGGNAGKTSPEELILAALSSCFSMTLGFVLEKRKVPARLLGMHAEGTVQRINRQLVLTGTSKYPISRHLTPYYCILRVKPSCILLIDDKYYVCVCSF